MTGNLLYVFGTLIKLFGRILKWLGSTELIIFIVAGVFQRFDFEKETILGTLLGIDFFVMFGIYFVGGFTLYFVGNRMIPENKKKRKKKNKEKPGLEDNTPTQDEIEKQEEGK